MRSYEFSKAWKKRKAQRTRSEDRKWESKSGPVTIRQMTDAEMEKREIEKNTPDTNRTSSLR